MENIKGIATHGAGKPMKHEAFIHFVITFLEDQQNNEQQNSSFKRDKSFTYCMKKPGRCRIISKEIKDSIVSLYHLSNLIKDLKKTLRLAGLFALGAVAAWGVSAGASQGLSSGSSSAL